MLGTEGHLENVGSDGALNGNGRRGNAMAKVLPKAPLVEVVFELRWALIQSQQFGPFGADPGYSSLREEFSRAAKRAGFRHVTDMQPAGVPNLGHSIDRRFYKSTGQAFPLLQIGPGIFAYNESAGYDWPKFKANCIKQVGVLLKSYPPLSSFKMSPLVMELRYIDVFDPVLEDGSPTDLFGYLTDQTNFGISRPTLPNSLNGLRKHATGRLIAEYEVEGTKETIFSMDFATGKKGDAKIFRMETKVRSTGKDVAGLNVHAHFLRRLGGWLEKAHSVTSPFFSELLGTERLARYR